MYNSKTKIGQPNQDLAEIMLMSSQICDERKITE